MKTNLYILLLVVAVLLSLCGRLPADIVVVNPIADTTLHAGAADNNMGGHDRLLAGIDGLGDPRHALVRFDIAGNIPALSTIDSVTLSMVVPDGNIANGSQFALHRLLVDWGEGSGTSMFGSPANQGDATWNSRMHGIAAWAAPGGMAGTDYESAASAVTFVDEFGTYEWTGMEADVQFWLDNPAGDFGWIMFTQSQTFQSARRFGSREAGGGLIPQLTVQYTPIPEPGTLSLAALGGLLLMAGLRRRARPSHTQSVQPAV